MKRVVGVLAILLVGCGQPVTSPKSEPPPSATVQDPSPATPSAQPTPRLFVVNELAGLSFSDGTVFDAPNVERKLTGVAALLSILPKPRGAVPSGFIESHLVERSGDYGTLLTYGALFRGQQEADEWFGRLERLHASALRWDLRVIGATEFGDEGVIYRGAAHGLPDATVYLWRVDNVVLAAVGVSAKGHTSGAVVDWIASGMAHRGGYLP